LSIKNHSRQNIFLSNLIIITLLILLASVSLINYKYIYNARANQEFYLKLFVLIAFFLWILKLVNNQKILLRDFKLNFPIFLFILWLTVSLIISNNKIISIRDYEIFISYFLIYFLILDSLNNEKQFKYFIIIFYIISFLVAIYAIIQYYGFDPYFNFINIKIK